MKNAQVRMSSRRTRLMQHRWFGWGLVFLAGLVAWGLLVLGAVLQKEYFVLFFPAAWALHVAIRQFRLMRPAEE